MFPQNAGPRSYRKVTLKIVVEIRIAWRHDEDEENRILRIHDVHMRKWMTVPTLEGIQNASPDGVFFFDKNEHNDCRALWDEPRIEYFSLGETIYPVLKLYDVFSSCDSLTENDVKWFIHDGGREALKISSTPDDQMLLQDKVSCRVDDFAAKVERDIHARVERDIHARFEVNWKPFGFMYSSDFELELLK
mgnify:CR=1 FL=1